MTEPLDGAADANAANAATAIKGADLANDRAGLPAPRSKTELFTTFTRMALQGFGGVLAVAQYELVERKHWLSRDEFVEMLSLAQVLPGPNVVNLSLMFGDRFFGVRGALAALAGMLLVPLFIVMALTALYAEFSHLPVVAGALRGMGAVAAGLIIATAIKLMSAFGSSRLGRPLAATFAGVTFVAIAWLRWPLIWVVVGLGTIAVTIAYRRSR
ncbi:MAG: chromate transporter [Caldimonas sp.]